MIVYERQTFDNFYDHESGAQYGDIEFRHCLFTRSVLSVTMLPSRRTRIHDVRLIRCEQKKCSIWSAILEDIYVEDLKTNGDLQTWGAVFKHVMLRGKIDLLMISPAIKGGMAPPETQRAFDAANDQYYRGVDWALDISEADFVDCDIRRVPANLVRRDPETQVVITRERAMRGEWRALDLERTHWKTSLEFFLERGDSDVVLVAGKRHRNFRELVRGLNLLREAGVAEPD